MSKPHPRRRARPLRFEVPVGGPATALETRLQLPFGVEQLGVELGDLGQPAQRDPIDRIGRSLFAVGHDQFFVGAGRNRKHSRREKIGDLLLEQGGVLAAVKKVFVHRAGALALDDLPLHPAVSDLHGQPADGGPRRQLDLKPSFEGTRLRILEAHVELGQREGAFYRSPDFQRRKRQTRPVGRRQSDGIRIGRYIDGQCRVFR